MNRKDKEVLVAHMKSQLERAKATFLVDYKGLDVKAMNRVRWELKKNGTEFYVVKNRLLRLASQDTETASIKEHFAGTSALAITYDDMVTPAKVLVDFSKDYEKLQIKAGQISGRPMDEKAINRLAELPGRDELLSQVLSAMQAVPSSLVRVLNGVLASLLNVLKAIETKRGNEKQEKCNE
ncbi:MAG: 50S ribosomal protein L10 [Thermodesulfobacteriota bacterium]|nr:50S ribosomal protein L10 [Thermodesulfobacteriota bacterium]